MWLLGSLWMLTVPQLTALSVPHRLPSSHISSSLNLDFITSTIGNVQIYFSIGISSHSFRYHLFISTLHPDNRCCGLDWFLGQCINQHNFELNILTEVWLRSICWLS